MKVFCLLQVFVKLFSKSLNLITSSIFKKGLYASLTKGLGVLLFFFNWYSGSFAKIGIRE